jgi:hypothetical protein
MENPLAQFRRTLKRPATSRGLARLNRIACLNRGSRWLIPFENLPLGILFPILSHASKKVYSALNTLFRFSEMYLLTVLGFASRALTQLCVPQLSSGKGISFSPTNFRR